MDEIAATRMKTAFMLLIFLVILLPGYSQKTFGIWPGVPAGSENWNWEENEDSVELPNDLLAYNVSLPTLTYFPANPHLANGTAVIICPGGSFCYLHVITEGAWLAKWLNQIGVACFVLRYRLVHSETNFPIQEKNQRMKDTASFSRLARAIVPLAIADAKQAIRYVREHAQEFALASNKIGILGFSAGGTLATASAFDQSPASRPDFVAPIYAFAPSMLIPEPLPEVPPIFIAAATDDELNLVPMSVNLYNKWLAAGRSAELHIYSKGGHGFGMNKKNQPSDGWVDRFGEWMKIQGFLKK